MLLTLPTKYTLFLHDFLFGLIKASICGCLILKLSICIFHTFMNCSSVFGKTSFWCCFKLTLSTRIIYSFMNCSFVPFKNSFCCCLILILSIWICHTFMSWKITFWCLLMLTLPQGYITFSWTALMCLARCLFDVAWCWHCLQ